MLYDTVVLGPDCFASVSRKTTHAVFKFLVYDNFTNNNIGCAQA